MTTRKLRYSVNVTCVAHIVLLIDGDTLGKLLKKITQSDTLQKSKERKCNTKKYPIYPN